LDRRSITSLIALIISVVSIIYALIFNLPDWMVIGISVLFIPVATLSFGLLIMARARKDEEEDRTKEPFIGY
jgi:energy-converting hydrogenase A subunit I